jgi:hypothetical protein
LIFFSEVASLPAHHFLLFRFLGYPKSLSLFYQRRVKIGIRELLGKLLKGLALCVGGGKLWGFQLGKLAQ